VTGEKTRMTAHPFRYPSSAAALAFPLGGVGTGNVSLGARGEWRDWEIFNSQGKGRDLPNTFWALYTRQSGAAPVARVLEGRFNAPHPRSHGYHPSMAAGLPRFAEVSVRGEYPFAWFDFADPDVPVSVRLEAYTPLVPLDPEASGIPCAVLSFQVTNRTGSEVRAAVAGSIMNPVGGIGYGEFGNPIAAGPGRNLNEFRSGEQLSGLHLRGTAIDPAGRDYGDLSLTTDHRDVTAKPVWLRGRWHDYLREFWRDFSADGRLDDLGYTDPSPPGQTDTGSLAADIVLPPGGSETVTFYLTWHFPNRPASWDRRPGATMTRNHYATRFTDSWDVALRLHADRHRLEALTRQFHAALFDSTVPPAVLRAVSASIVPARGNTCFWLADGGFYGYEGCFDDHGSCAGTCSHVWSYAYTVASLFPSLERRMRDTEFLGEQHEDGYLPFRSLRVFGEEDLWSTLEIGRRHPGKRMPAATDGQLGTVVRVYREWLLSGDRAWLDRIWPRVRAALDYAIRTWDPAAEGVPRGAQHTTYDIEFHGPNPLCATYYLAALRAGAQLAVIQDDQVTAKSYQDLFERGRVVADRLLWNGRYYQQSAEEIGEHPYQHGTGCLSDQLLGQLHARLLGLGDLLPPDRVRAALRAVYDNNFRSSLLDHVNTQRTFALNDEAGLLLCTWPEGDMPAYPFIYSDEVWTGIEYQVAAHLAAEGLAEPALAIVEAASARHDGLRRSPWDEVESGHHYARSMSAWALLAGLSGFRCDLGRGSLSFDPVLAASTDPDRFATLWCTGRGWGTYRQERDPASGEWLPSVTVLGGDLTGVTVTACGRTWTI
jgi:non-lysosomal glucosylceramidase